MQKDNPCHGCTAEDGRTPTCKFDGSCGLYAEWQAYHKRQKEAYRAYKQADYIDNGYAKETNARLNKRRRSKHDD